VVVLLSYSASLIDPNRKQADVKDSVFAEQKVLDSPLRAAKINAVEG
jgi:hypothetical protein